MADENGESGGRSGRWRRREKRRTAERGRIKKHGATIGKVYVAAVRRRTIKKRSP